MPSDRATFKDGIFLAVAATIAQLGTCDRAHVGAVIARNGRCISWGFNGAPPGMPHCDENEHGWMIDTRITNTEIDAMLAEHGCRNATHAEANALAFAAREGISTDGATLYVTVSPCEVCARLLIAAGISRVVYATPYRNASGGALLDQAGIEVRGFHD